MKRGRMLADHQVDGVNYKVDQVVDFPDAAADGLAALGVFDGHPDAVAHCVEGLKVKPLAHPVAEAEKPKEKAKK